jgi:hypothetical protein
MIKKIATGILAIAATSAVALSLSSLPASATTTDHSYDDYSEYWGPVYAWHHLAKAQGHVTVNWDEDDSNEVEVSGRLYDLDNRSYDEGGKCSYVKFQTSDSEGDWSTSYTRKYCGYPDYKRFSFSDDDVYSVRVKVCQIGLHSSYAKNCGHWDYIYSAESE